VAYNVKVLTLVLEKPRGDRSGKTQTGLAFEKPTPDGGNFLGAKIVLGEVINLHLK
jgi:hypothetical protein